GAFDRVILYEDHYVRGRQQGEIMALFRKGLEAGGRVTEVLEVRGAIKALETAIRQARPGDLMLLQADEIDETVNYVRNYLASGNGGREIPFREAVALGQPGPEPVFAPEARAGHHVKKVLVTQPAAKA